SQAGALAKTLTQSSPREKRFPEFRALQRTQYGTREKLAGDERRHGIARQTKEEPAAGPAEHQRLTGPDGDPAEVKLRTQFREYLFHEIVFTGRDAAAQQQQVRLQSLLDQRPQLIDLIG